MPQVRSGVVSVVLVNYRGAEDTIGAVAQLRQLDWPQELLEIVVVDNDSRDGSLERLRSELSGVVVVPSGSNLGFAGGCNLGVTRSSGEFIAFLNNDAKPDRGWVRAAVARFASSPAVGAVASKVLDWDGRDVDYVGGALTWYGMGYKPRTGDRDTPDSNTTTDVLFGTGAAMFVRRSVFEELGGFDERYFMFFEDVDLGWRLNLLGHRFVYEPASLAFHKHHASMGGFGSFREQYLLERNALFTLYKNLDSASLARILPAAMALSIRRAVSQSSVDSSSFEITAAANQDEAETQSVPKLMLSSAFGIDQFIDQLPSLGAARELVQRTRTRSDAALWRLFGEVDAPIHHDKRYLDGYENLVATFGVVETPAAPKVLVVTGDPIGAKLAGPAIRAWNIAEAISATNPVRLVSLSGVERAGGAVELFHVRAGDDRSFVEHEAWADIIIFQGHAMSVFESLRRSSKVFVIDIYDPMHLEQLEQGRELPPAQWERQVRDATDVLNEQLERGDFFICASERQRHFYLGQLAALGRLSPVVYADDPDLTKLIDAVPFGISSTPPTHTRQVLKGEVAGIGAEDKVVLWSGGLYNWFDPQTLIRAIALLAESRPEVKLFFQGTKHPHPGVPVMGIVAESKSLAEELGVLGTSVFFNDSWVDFGDRQNYLLEADLGVSTHHRHIETTFSFRTRIVDYLWAELPMVVTAGDHFADLVEREGLGIVVADGDVTGLRAAIETVLFDADFADRARENIRRVRREYFWENALAPLLRFVQEPHRALDAESVGGTTVDAGSRRRRRSGMAHDLRQTAHYLREGGPLVVARKVVRRLGIRRSGR